MSTDSKNLTRATRQILKAEILSNDAVAVTASKGELAYLMNTMNEVLRGVQIDNFEARLGGPLDSARHLWEKLSAVFHTWTKGHDSCQVTFSRVEIAILRNASRLCLEEFDPDEFATRLGENVRTGLAVIDALEKSSRGNQRAG